MAESEKKKENYLGSEFAEGEEKPAQVPFYVFESEITRAEKRFNRVVTALIAAIICLFLETGAWLLYESFYDTINYSQDGEGLNNINTGTQGNLYGAESKSKDIT